MYPDPFPVIDGSGIILTATDEEGKSWELNIYNQNEKGSVVCSGGSEKERCKLVFDGKGVALWVYIEKTDTLTEKSFGRLLITPRKTCSVRDRKTFLQMKEPIAQQEGKTKSLWKLRNLLVRKVNYFRPAL